MGKTPLRCQQPLRVRVASHSCTMLEIIVCIALSKVERRVGKNELVQARALRSTVGGRLGGRERDFCLNLFPRSTVRSASGAQNSRSQIARCRDQAADTNTQRAFASIPSPGILIMSLPDEGDDGSDTCSAITDVTDAAGNPDSVRAAVTEASSPPESDRPPRRPRTSLLTLPPELHNEIFKHLRTYRAGKRPICRALWPMTRRNLFRAVRIWTPERPQRFASLMRPMHRTYRDPSLLRELWQSGRLIKVLDIKVQPPRRRWRTPPDASDSDDSTADGSVTPDVMPDIADSTASSQIRAVLTQATRVRRLTMSGPQALEYLLPAKSGFAWLRELEQLTLKIFGGSVQLWSAEGLSRLRRFPRLKELYLDLSKLGESALTPTASSTTLRPVPQIHQLHLHLRTCTVHAEIVTCMTFFSGTKKLVVDLNVVEGADNVDAR